MEREFMALSGLPTLDDDDVVERLEPIKHKAVINGTTKGYLSRVIWVIHRGFDDMHRLYTFNNTDTAAYFLSRRPVYRSVLYIGGRKYDLPDSSRKPELFKEHIVHCIDLEASFYNTASCVAWMDEYNEKKKLWVYQPGEIE